jgi:uncharacterized protein (TIGR02145 family)
MDHKGKPPLEIFYTIITSVFLMMACDKAKEDSGVITVSDIDGNVYKTVSIGSQIWMAGNLNTTHFNDGSVIPDGTLLGAISGQPEQKLWFAYNDNLANADTFGRLYTWYAANNSHKICPSGWHVPTDNDWNVLEVNLGMSALDTSVIGDGNNLIGGKLKETGTMHWRPYNTGATDEINFGALPGGYRTYREKDFDYKGELAVFWTSTTSKVLGQDYAMSRQLWYMWQNISKMNDLKIYAFSIRCLKD